MGAGSCGVTAALPLNRLFERARLISLECAPSSVVRPLLPAETLRGVFGRFVRVSMFRRGGTMYNMILIVTPCVTFLTQAVIVFFQERGAFCAEIVLKSIH